MDRSSYELYAKLGELVRYLEGTMRKLQSLEEPLATTAGRLPQASAHLRDLTHLAEQGTHTVMGHIEALLENVDRLKEALVRLSTEIGRADGAAGEQPDPAAARIQQMQAWLAEDEQRLIEILTALSFQDLLAQRVAKIVAILEEVERRLVELVVVFGPRTPDRAPQPATQADVLLQQLEASRSTALNQHLVDTILAQYGF